MKKRILCVMMALLMILLIQSPLLSAEVIPTAEEPMLTVACISDLHNQQSLITSIPVRLRGTVSQTLSRIGQEEKIDTMIIGGDNTSDVSNLPEANFLEIRRLMVEASRNSFPAGSLSTPVVYVNGNHDYEVSRSYNAGDFYSFPMKDDIGVLDDNMDPENGAANAFYEFSNDGKFKLLAGYHYVIKGFDFVVLNTGKFFYADAWDYTYSAESIRWIENKLADICSDGNKNRTILFSAHVPLPESNSISATNKGLKSVSADQLRAVVKEYPNLIYMYGHDHGTNSAYIRTDTAQRVTEYDVNGNKIAREVVIPEGVRLESAVWTFTQSGSGYYITDVNGRYLGRADNLDTVTTPALSTVSGSNGSYTIAVETANAQKNVYLSSSSLTFSTNSNATSLSLYKKTGTSSYTKATSIESGSQYLIVAQSGGSYYALHNLNNGSTGSNARMQKVDVTVSNNVINYTAPLPDSLPNPEIVSAVWTFTQTQGGYHITEATGRYLGRLGNLNSVPTPSVSTVTENGGLFNIAVETTSNDKNVYFSSSSLTFSGNSKTGSLMLFKKTGDTEFVRASSIESGQQYLIVVANEGKYYALLNQTNGATGSSIRMEKAEVTVDGNTATYQLPAPPDPAAPGFLSTFMGSMRYYNNSIDGNVGASDSRVVQALMIYIYADRVELQMKNYGETGVLNGITIAPVPTPYISYRTVENSAQQPYATIQSAPASAYVNEDFTIRVKARPEVTGFRLVNETDRAVSIGSISESNGVWNITTKVGTAGVGRQLTLIPLIDGEYQDIGLQVTMDILANTVSVGDPAMALSAQFDRPTAVVNELFQVTVRTNSLTEAVQILNHNGKGIGKTLVKKQNVDGERVWVFQMAVGTAGTDRTFTFVPAKLDMVYNSLTATTAQISVVKAA